MVFLGFLLLPDVMSISEVSPDVMSISGVSPDVIPQQVAPFREYTVMSCQCISS